MSLFHSAQITEHEVAIVTDWWHNVKQSLVLWFVESFLCVNEWQQVGKSTCSMTTESKSGNMMQGGGKALFNLSHRRRGETTGERLCSVFPPL